ncbi:MAG: hypothetical protein PSY12_13940 [bacterium]|nr:hypothetical protein [bacterium]
MRTLILLATALSLAACGKSPDTGALADTRGAPETGATAQVARLDEGQRNGVFERAIRASGAACPVVKSSERTEVRHGVQGWKAHCDNDTAHLIEVLSDGTAKVTSRIH